MAESKQKTFDPGKPHGTVYGHLSGKFEQDGVLFGANGKPIGAKQIEDEEERLGDENREAEAARRKELANK